MVCVTSKDSLGCSFFDWSLNFLSGNNSFFNIIENQHIPISYNPVNAYNSHGHKRNHPVGLGATIEYVQQFQKQSSGLYTMYPCPLNIDDACNILNIDHSHIPNPEMFQRIYQCQDQDYIDMINFCIDQAVHVIYVHKNYQSVGYFWNRRTLDRQLLKLEPYENVEHAQADFQKVFFEPSIQSWDTLGSVTRWDTRERIALNIRPFDHRPAAEVGITRSHLWVDCQDLWHNTDAVLVDAMKFIGVDIDPQRRDQWMPIMHNWQAIQRKQLKFYYAVDHIVNSIVNNWYYPLSPMSLYQEAIIQHCLIYKHNLNLKTWQLDSFPSNTQDLHKLLEPSCHAVSKIY